MSRWQRTLDLVDIWADVSENRLPNSKFCAQVAERLAAVIPLTIPEVEDRRKELVVLFNQQGLQSYVSTEVLDDLMDLLYDWGDTPLDARGLFQGKRVCWVKTIF